MSTASIHHRSKADTDLTLQNSLDRFEERRSRHFFDIITDNESWFYHYDPQIKERSKMSVPKVVFIQQKFSEAKVPVNEW